MNLNNLPARIHSVRDKNLIYRRNKEDEGRFSIVETYASIGKAKAQCKGLIGGSHRTIESLKREYGR